jgi:hypothetical protein
LSAQERAVQTARFSHAIAQGMRVTAFAWFCLSLRIMGAWVRVTGAELLVFGIEPQQRVRGLDCVLGLGLLQPGRRALLIGLLLLKLAPFFARLVYPGTGIGDVAGSPATSA